MNIELTRNGNAMSLATSLRRRIHIYSISLLGILAILFGGVQSNLMAQPPQGSEYFAYEYSIPVVGNPSDMAMGDFNQDGLLDMVVTSSIAGELEIFLGKLGGGFQLDNTEIFDCPTGAFEASSLDFDGDGNLDLIILTSSGLIHVMLGDGEGDLQNNFNLTLGIGFVTSFEFGDLNGDDQLDIAISTLSGISGGGETRLLLSVGNGDYSLSAQLFPSASALAVEDVNGDGDLDLITAGDQLAVHLNDGSASFVVSHASDLSYDVDGLMVGDVFLDGNTGNAVQDILCLTDGGEGLAFLQGVGGGSFSEPVEGYENQLSNAVDLTLVELDGQDGPELVYISQDSDSHIGVLTGHGSDGIPFEGFQEIPISQDPQCLKVLDINQDGILDAIVASSAANVIEVYLGQPPAPDFERGDANWDSQLNIADAIDLLGILFQQNSPGISCMDVLDCNDDGSIDLSDPISLLNFLFGQTSSLPEPFLGCGSDPTSDTLECLPSLDSPCP
ncbi:MAG: FG-GAP-like repeat-containing protein [Planctomycetota bacterium]|nr:FG-GAP-like repeat-containing protein [Planctomycetota bacterium]